MVWILLGRESRPLLLWENALRRSFGVGIELACCFLASLIVRVIVVHTYVKFFSGPLTHPHPCMLGAGYMSRRHTSEHDPFLDKEKGRMISHLSGLSDAAPHPVSHEAFFSTRLLIVRICYTLWDV